MCAMSRPGSGAASRGGRGARQDRGRFPRDADARATRSCSPADAALRGHPRERVLRLQRAPATTPRCPIYAGGKFPLSTYLADQVRGMLADPDRWKQLPDQVADWLRLQRGQIGAAAPRRPAGRDLSARQPLLHGRLSLRRPARAPDARHAADPPAGAGRRSARSASSPPTIRSPSGALDDMGAHVRERQAVARRPLRRGHAGRRPRGLAGRELAA